MRGSGDRPCLGGSRLTSTDPFGHIYVTSTTNSSCNSDESDSSSADETDEDQGSKWITKNAYNLTAFEQEKGPWRNDHPLPMPVWSEKPKRALVVDKVSYQFNN